MWERTSSIRLHLAKSNAIYNYSLAINLSFMKLIIFSFCFTAGELLIEFYSNLSLPSLGVKRINNGNFFQCNAIQFVSTTNCSLQNVNLFFSPQSPPLILSMILLVCKCIMTARVYLHWPCRTVSQGTDSVSLNLLTELPNHVDLWCACIAFHKTPHHVVHPVHSYSNRWKGNVLEVLQSTKKTWCV